MELPYTTGRTLVSVETLRRLTNRLVHPPPISRATPTESPEGCASGLRGLGIADSPTLQGPNPGSAIKVGVRRFLLATFVALIAVSTSGVMDLVLPEPCSIDEVANGQEDGDCAATCVRCNCCARSIEVAAVTVLSVRLSIPAESSPFSQFFSSVSPADILHVPKLS
jgi:hypothetical protein